MTAVPLAYFPQEKYILKPSLSLIDYLQGRLLISLVSTNLKWN